MQNLQYQNGTNYLSRINTNKYIDIIQRTILTLEKRFKFNIVINLFK